MHTRSFVARLLWMTMMKALSCHSDDRREEESRKHKVGCNVDAHEILRRKAPLDDKRWKRKKRLCETPCHSVVNKSN